VQERLSSPSSVAVGGAVFLGLFALLYSVGSALGAWPPAPEGGFHGVDLAAGFAFGLILLAALVVPRRSALR
jgi:hypothetical protein